MVALATVQEFFRTGVNGVEGTDEVQAIFKDKISLPRNFRIYQGSHKLRQWMFRLTQNMSGYITVQILESIGSKPDRLVMSIQGSWREEVEGLEGVEAIRVDLNEFRTAKQAVEALFQKFVDRFQKPSSEGNVKVFYDESQFIWCWKRPNSASFVKDEQGNAYLIKTSLNVYHVLGGGVVPDEHVILSYEDRSRISNGTHPTIKLVNGAFFFKACLVPIYRNQIPFDHIHTHVPEDQARLYEFVMVNDERRYINLRRAENSLLDVPVSQYNVRIEQLVPKDKLFLFGKTDLYAKRDKAEVPFIGWELEAVCPNSSVGKPATATAFKEQLPWLVMCKDDGSVGSNGFETVSVPATLDFWKESNLSSALDSMRVPPYNMRSYESANCGFHVHVSRSALSVLDLQKMERFVHNPDNNSFITKIANRVGGNYQKYSPQLFNERAKIKNPGGNQRTFGRSGVETVRIVAEEIKYFKATLDEVYEAVSTYYLPASGSTDWQKIGYLMSAIDNLVSYEYLDLIIGGQSSSIHDRYSRVIHYSMSDLHSDSRRASPVYLRDVCGLNGGNFDEYVRFYKALFEEVLCANRPKFSKFVKFFFPDWNLVTEEEPPAAPVPDWRAALLKSKAPYSRKFSKKASTIVKGPVGKGTMARYDALNTTNESTIEFRMFKGTMNGSTIMRYLEFVDALVRFVANTTATNEGVHYTAFVKWLKSDAFNVARYEHLISFITEQGFLDRKEIRKKTLVKSIAKDSDVTGIVATPAKGFVDLVSPRPIGSFTTTPSNVVAQTSNDEEEATEEAMEEDYDPDPPLSPPDILEGCECPVCRPDLHNN